MENNIFEELQAKKQKMATLINKAEEFGWIKAEEKAEYLSKLNNDVLTIGVIGQMKAGKSTFLNAFVFEDDVLPAATTPMTAALSVITYGSEKKLVAEFYTKDEWDEQKMNAQMSLDDVADELTKSKIKAAQDLVEKSARLGDVNSFLGKTQEDSFDNLEEYVGAKGKYVSITKAVNIYYPKEYLKGVNIVDTPGFNDPIVSREERTKEFLGKADVVLLMLYAGRPFDATDRSILFKNVGECGIGKVLIGINKYDIPYGNGETEDEIRTYVKKEILKASQTMGDEQLNDILRDTEPIPLSAEMALLSHLPMSKISESKLLSSAWKRNCETFEISAQTEMRKKSHLDELVIAVRQVIEKEKEAILFKKPLNAILAKGNNLKAKNEEELIKTINEIHLLQTPDEELEERKESLSRVTRRLNKKINRLGDDLDETFSEIIRKGSNELEDELDNCCHKLDRIIDAWGRFESDEKLITDMNKELQFFVTRTLKRKSTDISRNAKNVVRRNLDEFFSDTEEILLKLPESNDFDVQDFVKDVSGKFNFENDDKSLFTFSDDDENTDHGWLDIAGDFLINFLNGYTFGLSGVLTKAFTHDSIQSEAKKNVANIQSSFEPRIYLEKIVDSKDKIIKEVKKSFLDELLTPLQEQLDGIKQKGIDKAGKLEEAKALSETLQSRKMELLAQIQEIEKMK